MNQRFLPLLTTISLFAVACSTGKASYREAAPPSPAVQAAADGSTPLTTGGSTALATGGSITTVTTATGGEPQDSRPQAPTSPLLIYTSALSLEANENEVKDLSGKIIDKAKGLGGYLSQRSSNSLMVRVPAKDFNTLNDFIKTLAKVKYENVTAQDVTLQYTDLKIRLDVQTKMLARYNELLKRAANVKEAVEVERELSRITERVEQLKGQIRYYDSQIGYSTINVTFQEPYTAFNKESKPGPLGWVFYGLYVGVKWLFIWD